MASSNLRNIQAPATGAIPMGDVVRLAYAAGFRGNDLVTAVAIAVAESGLVPTALGDQGLETSTWGPSVGLWQIRSLNVQSGTGQGRDQTVNVDPWRNAQAAFDLYRRRGGKFTDWTAFTRGRYQKFVDEARQAVNDAGGERGINANITQARSQGLYAASFGKPPSAPSGMPAPTPEAIASSQATARAAPTPGQVGRGNAPTSAPAAPVGGGAGGGGPIIVNATQPSYVQPTTDPYPSQGTAAQQDQWIRAHYGAIAYMLDDPEIGPILREAAAGGWDDGRFTARLQQTHWFQTHNTGARAFDALVHTDPQQAEQQLRDQTATVRQQAATKGITLSDARAREIALHGLQSGFGPGDWDKAIAAEFHYNAPVMINPASGRPVFTGPQGEAGGSVTEGNVPAGATTWTMPDGRQAWYFPGRGIQPGNVAALASGVPSGFTGGSATTAEQMRERAGQYGVTFSDQDIATWIGLEMKGDRTNDDFEAELRRRASASYSYWADEINRGMTPMELAGNYVQTLARVNGRNPASITLNDPEIRAALGYVDPATGKRMEMGDWRFEQYLKRDGSPYMTDPNNTDAINSAASLVSFLDQKMGKTA